MVAGSPESGLTTRGPAPAVDKHHEKWILNVSTKKDSFAYTYDQVGVKRLTHVMMYMH